MAADRVLKIAIIGLGVFSVILASRIIFNI
jgi:hypothetical protein